ncbi:MAG: cell division protein FtsA [Minwuia sp.]|uniref:cell division protein FtsA n=1 Tax=Minwuia sp. TaxID=2493630 RepID=UPI003A8433EA
MASVRSSIVAALDVGSSKVSCAIAAPHGEGHRVLGAAMKKAYGLRKGVVTDMEAAEAAIRAAVDIAERMAGTQVDEVFVTLSGGSPASHTVGVEVTAPDRPIDDHDVRRLLRQAGARSEPGERSVLHAIPVGFSLDGESGIADPRGMVGRRLGLDVHIATAASFAQRNLEACVSRAHLRPADLIAGAYAAGLGALTDDERNLGTAVVDLGAGVTKIGMFRDGNLVHVDSVPIGGAHITNDVARILATSIDAAERLKTTRGGVFVGPQDDDTTIPVPAIGDGWTEAANQMPLSLLIGVIRPRAEEIFETVRERIESSGHAAMAGRKIVITGGGSLLSGIDRLAHDILDKPVRVGRPQNITGLPEAMSGPAHTALTGSLCFADRRLEARARLDAPVDSGRRGGFARIGRWLRENF